MPQAQSEANLGTVISLVAERFLTGASLLLRGHIGEGLLHTGAGMLAYNFFGLPGVLAVSANSFARAETGQNVLQLATSSLDSRRSEAPAETTATTTKRS